jgi:hypothetical protein
MPSSRRAYVIAKKLGQTNVYFYDAQGRQIEGLNVNFAEDHEIQEVRPEQIVTVVQGQEGKDPKINVYMRNWVLQTGRIRRDRKAVPANHCPSECDFRLGCGEQSEVLVCSVVAGHGSSTEAAKPICCFFQCFTVSARAIPLGAPIKSRAYGCFADIVEYSSTAPRNGSDKRIRPGRDVRCIISVACLPKDAT